MTLHEVDRTAHATLAADASDPAQEREQQPDHGHDHEPVDTASLSWLQRRILATITFYQRIREGKPSPCRFFPSCSSYALEAFEVHGTWRGGWLTVRRLGRCRPLGPSGFDPVPPRSDADDPAPPSSASTSPKGG